MTRRGSDSATVTRREEAIQQRSLSIKEVIQQLWLSIEEVIQQWSFEGGSDLAPMR